MEFQYVTIGVSDLARSRRFYEDILGFKPDMNCENWQSYAIEGDAGFAITEEPELRRVPCSDVINFSLPEIDSLWERVRDRVRVESAPQVMPWGTRKFIILDPDGMRLGFVEQKRVFDGDSGG